MNRQKKAFTLTELLVVVVIIGVLSAVVLPKYSKMLNTRRTTEAEDIMSAVRQEQEYRCASDRNYTTAKTDLSSLASLPDNLSSKNYTYTLGGSGITATAKTGSYNLQMPSYTDGRICCSGDGCSNLNKDYVACNSIPVSNSGCEVEDPGVAQASAECTDGEVRGSQSCSTCGGVQTTQKCVNGAWTASLGECSVAQSSCSCEMISGPQPSNESVVCNSCGTKTISYSCNTTNWTWEASSGTCISKIDGKTVINNESDCPKCWTDKQYGGAYDRCLDDHYGAVGSWNDENCSCECQTGSFLNQDDSCEDRCFGKDKNLLMQNCTQPASSYFARGSWHPEDCSCECPLQDYEIDEEGHCACPEGYHPIQDDGGCEKLLEPGGGGYNPNPDPSCNRVGWVEISHEEHSIIPPDDGKEREWTTGATACQTKAHVGNIMTRRWLSDFSAGGWAEEISQFECVCR